MKTYYGGERMCEVEGCRQPAAKRLLTCLDCDATEREALALRKPEEQRIEDEVVARKPRVVPVHSAFAQRQEELAIDWATSRAWADEARADQKWSDDE